MTAAIFIVFIGCVSAQHIFYSDQLRGYVFAFGSIALSFYGLTNLLTRSSSTLRSVACYAIGAVLAIYLHTTFFLWPVIATVSMVLASVAVKLPLRRFFIPLMLANIVILLASGWWAYITYLQIRVPNPNITWIKPEDFAMYRFTVTSTAFLTKNAYGWQRAIVYCGMALTIFGAVTTWRNAATKLVVITALCAFAIFRVADMVHPIAIDRTVFWMSIFPMILISAAIGSGVPSKARQVVGALYGGLLIVQLSMSLSSFGTEDWGGVLRRAAADPHGVVVVEGSAMNVVTPIACRLAFDGNCPVPIVSIQGVRFVDAAWAEGLAGPTQIAPKRLAHVLPDTAALYTIKRATDPAVTLGLVTHQRDVNFAMQGPFTVAQISPTRR